MFRIDLGLKFGSNEIIVYKKGCGIVAKEPAYLAVTTSGKSIKVHAIGKKAEKLFNSKSTNYQVYRPIENGEIVNEKMAKLLLGKIVENVVEGNSFITNVYALVAVPSALNEKQLLLIKKVLHESGVNKVEFVFNSVCVQSNLDFDSHSHVMVVDIGKNITDISVLNEYNFCFGRMYFLGGEDMDKSIVTFVADNFGLNISKQTAESIKNEVASLYNRDMYSYDFVGTNENGNLARASITANDVRLAISNVYDAIFERIDEILKSLPAEVANDVYNTGIVFVGGGSKIAGLYEYAKKKLDFPVIVSDQPEDAVVLGLGKLLCGGKEFLKQKVWFVF